MGVDNYFNPPDRYIRNGDYTFEPAALIRFLDLFMKYMSFTGSRSDIKEFLKWYENSDMGVNAKDFEKKLGRFKSPRK